MRWLACIALLLLAGCGGGEEEPQLVVSAASSLKTAFTSYGEGFDGADVRLSLAGSDELAAQIRQGVRPDVFAAANTKLPEQLHREGLLERPRVFAGNELVVAVPRGSEIGALEDLAADGVTVAAGAEGVPVGDYTRDVLARAGAGEAILANIRSNEPDVNGVIGKLTQGAVDAGFVYRSDVVGTEGRLRAIPLPAGLRPKVAYAAAVVKGAPHPDQARAFVAGLLEGAGAQALRDSGFLPPPGS
jgi:molybdate transport system substrate-binding protein